MRCTIRATTRERFIFHLAGVPIKQASGKPQTQPDAQVKSTSLPAYEVPDGDALNALVSVGRTDLRFFGPSQKVRSEELVVSTKICELVPVGRKPLIPHCQTIGGVADAAS